MSRISKKCFRLKDVQVFSGGKWLGMIMIIPGRMVHPEILSPLMGEG
jgi:hypothetical protein